VNEKQILERRAALEQQLADTERMKDTLMGALQENAHYLKMVRECHLAIREDGCGE
jgi:hypothetical protein